MKPSANMVGRENRERTSTLEASIRMGARNDGMCNICELLINVVKVNRPKMLTGLNQKVRGMVEVFVCHLTRSIIPSANRQTLNYRVLSAEPGKPNYLHVIITVESNPQGKPTGKWVKDAGKSECRSVIDRIWAQALPSTKVSRLPAGVGSREPYESI
jgi:hypothetical protein